MFNGEPTNKSRCKVRNFKSHSITRAYFYRARTISYEGQDIMVLDVLDALIQTNIVTKQKGEEME